MKSRLIRKNFFVVLVLMVLVGLVAEAATADPNLVGWWKFEEGQGDIAYDSAGENDGTLINNPTWTSGRIGGALSFDGINDYVEVPDSASLDITDEITLGAWVLIRDVTSEWDRIVVKAFVGDVAPWMVYGIGRVTNSRKLIFDISTGANLPNGMQSDTDVLVLNEWTHVAATFDGSTLSLFVNGEFSNSIDAPHPGYITTNNIPLSIGANNVGKREYLNGKIDEVRIYDKALSAEEILQLYGEGFGGRAFNPEPDDGATSVDLDKVLSWFPGKDAASHDVYFGTNYNDVNDATTASAEYMGNQDTNSWVPYGLEYDSTYYWRIDEVEGPNTWKGDVWSFTTATFTAHNPSPADGAIYVSIDAALSWDAGFDALSHDVYFGTTIPPQFQGNQTETIYVPGMMNANTTYYWRIDEVGPGGTIAGELWSFTTGSVEVIVASRARKICQLVGDWDRERGEPTINLTKQRYNLTKTDLGAPFRHKDRTYIVFGDAWYPTDDPIAYTTDTTPEDGLELTFLHNGPDPNGYGPYRPIKIPGVRLWAYEVPMEGVSINGRMYIYATTDHSWAVTMGRSVVAVSDDDGYTFEYLYDLSTDYFINVSIVETELSGSDSLPGSQGVGLVMFGSGTFRESNVRLAFQPAAEVESPSSIRYFAGLGDNDEPLWSSNEADAIELFNQPCVGELSVSYNRFIRKWIMLYNCCCEESLRGINMRTADKPWGPWSEPKIIFHPWDDGGYCHFMHTNWNYMNCDSVHDPGRAYEWGGEYGPYQFEDLAVGDCSTTTIYFTMSTWNPYTVVLMSATLQIVTEEPIRAPMKFTPRALNCRSKGKWVKAHFVFPESFGVEDVDADAPASLEPFGIESDYVNIFANEEGLVEIEIAFDRAAFCTAGIDYRPVEVTVTGLLSNCQYFYGTDTIRIITKNLEYLAVFASHWLEVDCGVPDWCSGVDLDQNTVVDFADFALLDGCCIEVIKE